MQKTIKRIFSYTVFYEVALEGGYVALVPALPGCHTQGETLEETEIHTKEAIEVYLESLIAHGESIPLEKKSYYSTIKVPATIPV